MTIDTTKITPEKLAEMNDSLITDNNHLRQQLIQCRQTLQSLAGACDTGERDAEGKQRGTIMPERYVVQAAHDYLKEHKL